MSAQIIELEGQPVFAVVPIAEWNALLERLETLQDLADFNEATAHPEETLPLEFIERRLAGESPLTLWREHRGFTVQALAEQVGCTQHMLSMLEQRKTVPSDALLNRLAHVLQCDTEDLYVDESLHF